MGRRNREKKRLLLACAIIVCLVFGVAFAAYLLLFRTPPVREKEEIITDGSAGKSRPETALFRTYEKASDLLNTAEDREEPAAEEETADESGQAEAAAPEDFREMLQTMSLEEKTAQLFVITPEQLTGYRQVTQCGEVTYRALDRYPVGGIIYFANNLESGEQTRQMLQAIQTYATDRTGLPLFLAVDEEGGRVAHVADSLEDLPKTAPMGEVARDGEEAVYEAALVIGNYLSGLGFNLNFAPDADVLTNPENTAIGDRSFGEDAETVTKMAGAFLRGLANNGITGVYKHFPGHGGTSGDTHEGYAYVNRTVDELKERELKPFLDGIEKNVPMMMVAHVSLPLVTGSDVPATLSKEVVTGLLRQELGYNGVVVTDALNMDAIAGHYSNAQAAVMALEAGCDILLMPSDFTGAYEAVLQAVANGTLTEERIDESVLRILTLKQLSRR